MIARGVPDCTGKGWGTACACACTGLCTGLSSPAQRPLGGEKGDLMSCKG